MESILLRDVSFDDANQTRCLRAIPNKSTDVTTPVTMKCCCSRAARAGNTQRHFFWRFCPVCDMKSQIDFVENTRSNWDLDSPMFLGEHGSTLDRNKIDAKITDFVKMLDMDMYAENRKRKKYSTHSMRVGGTIGALVGLTAKAVVKDIGRWSSDCVDDYARRCLLDPQGTCGFHSPLASLWSKKLELPT
jgi:hypothetical protein